MKKSLYSILIAVALTACSGSGDKQAITDVGHARSMGIRLAEAQYQLRQARNLFGEESEAARSADSLIVLINDSIRSADADVKQIFREAYQERSNQLEPKVNKTPAREQQLSDSSLKAMQLDEEMAILNPL